MIFLFDNNFSPRLVRVLQALGVDARAFRDEFQPDTKDEEYLRAIRDSEWVLLTADKHILTRRAEARALKESGVTALIFKAFWPKMCLWPQAHWLTKHWMQIDVFAESALSGTCAEVQQSGKNMPSRR